MIDSPNSLCTLINTRGRVATVRMWEVPMLRAQGWRVINNPKEDYYPAYDLTLTQHFVEDLPGSDSTIDVEDSLEFIDV